MDIKSLYQLFNNIDHGQYYGLIKLCLKLKPIRKNGTVC